MTKIVKDENGEALVLVPIKMPVKKIPLAVFARDEYERGEARTCRARIVGTEKKFPRDDTTIFASRVSRCALRVVN